MRDSKSCARYIWVSLSQRFHDRCRRVACIDSRRVRPLCLTVNLSPRSMWKSRRTLNVHDMSSGSLKVVTADDQCLYFLLVHTRFAAISSSPPPPPPQKKKKSRTRLMTIETPITVPPKTGPLYPQAMGQDPMGFVTKPSGRLPTTKQPSCGFRDTALYVGNEKLIS